MNPYKTPVWTRLPLIGVLAALQVIPIGCMPVPFAAPLTRQTENFTGSIDFATEKPTAFKLEGTSPDFGPYTAIGEVTFHEGTAQGSLLGNGVAVFETPNGDKIVAEVIWPVDAESGNERSGEIQFRWRDSVTFGDGTVAASTGQFADPAQRPPGLVVIAIIAILIGLLVPAVQKCPGANFCRERPPEGSDRARGLKPGA